MLSLDAASDRSENGFTLVEVVLTVALISIAFVGILTAVGGLITSGTQNRNAASSEAIVRNVAAYAQSSASMPYLPCNQSPLSSYDVSGVPKPAGFSASITNVQFWNGDSAPATFGNACPAAGDEGLELLTVSVSSSSTDLGGAFSRSLTVLKRSTP